MGERPNPVEQASMRNQLAQELLCRRVAADIAVGLHTVAQCFTLADFFFDTATERIAKAKEQMGG